MIGYICTRNKNIKDYIKYEIGKRYKFKKNIYYHKLYSDIEYFNSYMKIYKIKIYDNHYMVTRDFKILCEINYNDLLNSKNEHEQSISAIKNKEKLVLDKFIKYNELEKIEIVIESGVHKYLDEIVQNKNTDKQTISLIIKKYGRNKDLDNFIDCNNHKIIIEISNIGRKKDLDKLMSSNKIGVINYVLSNGRFKDIDYVLNNNYRCFYDTIIKTGIDKYLDWDFFIKDCGSYIRGLIAKQGRKGDLDILVHDKDEKIRSIVASHGHDRHLDMLVNDESKLVLQSVLDIGMDKDIKIIKSSPIANELHFSNNIE